MNGGTVILEALYGQDNDGNWFKLGTIRVPANKTKPIDPDEIKLGDEIYIRKESKPNREIMERLQ